METKILVVTDEAAEAAWNKHLPTPLRKGEKCVVDNDQKGVSAKFVRVRHGEKDHKVRSVFSLSHFTDLHGRPVKR